MKCTECGTEIKEDSAYCRMCGTKLGKPICGNCEATISPDAEYCENCGAAFTEGKENRQRQQGKTKQKETLSLLGDGVLVALGVVVLIIGAVVAIDAHQTMTEFQTTGGQVLRALSEQQQQRYDSLSVRRTAGVVGAFI